MSMYVNPMRAFISSLLDHSSMQYQRSIYDKQAGSCGYQGKAFAKLKNSKKRTSRTKKQFHRQKR